MAIQISFSSPGGHQSNKELVRLGIPLKSPITLIVGLSCIMYICADAALLMLRSGYWYLSAADSVDDIAILVLGAIFIAARTHGLWFRPALVLLGSFLALNAILPYYAGTARSWMVQEGVQVLAGILVIVLAVKVGRQATLRVLKNTAAVLLAIAAVGRIAAWLYSGGLRWAATWFDFAHQTLFVVFMVPIIVMVVKLSDDLTKINVGRPVGLPVSRSAYVVMPDGSQQWRPLAPVPLKARSIASWFGLTENGPGVANASAN